jgi:hypothetical protein
MVNIASETLIRLAEAAKLVPPSRRGKRTHESTVLRWILTGTKDRTGAVVHLEGIRLGGKWLTSCEALQRFAERLTPDLGTGRPNHPRSPGRRQRALERAGRFLATHGI